MVYGYTVEPHGMDPLVQLVDTALDNFAASTVPGSWFVDIIPARKFSSHHIDLSHIYLFFPAEGGHEGLKRERQEKYNEREDKTKIFNLI